jgi:chromosome segregation ATPase
VENLERKVAELREEAARRKERLQRLRATVERQRAELDSLRASPPRRATRLVRGVRQRLRRR